MIARGRIVALAGTALVAIGMPLFLLWPSAPVRRPPAPHPVPPLAVPAEPPLTTAFTRPLFAPAADPELADATPGDAPALIGIVGRLDQDAVALVRAADGSSRTLHIGESVDGWQLGSLAIDAAFFTRGSERVRVPLPVAEGN